MKDPVFGWLGFWFWRLVNLSVLSAAFSFICYFGVMFIWFDQFDVEHFLKAAENIFDYREKDRKTMIKMLEMIGLGFVAIMILGFVGSLQSIGIPMGASNPYFWGCAGGTLIIIMYRKRKRKQANQE